MPCPFNVGDTFRSFYPESNELLSSYRVIACGPDWCRVTGNEPGTSLALVFDIVPWGSVVQSLRPAQISSYGASYAGRTVFTASERGWWWNEIPSYMQLEITRREDARRRKLGQITLSSGMNIQRGMLITTGGSAQYRIVEVHEGGVCWCEAALAVRAPLPLVKPVPVLSRFERELEINDA